MRRPFRRFQSLLLVSACLFLLIPQTIHAKAEVIQKMKGLHVPFMANDGQMDERVSFYARTFGGTVFVTKDGEIVYSLPKVIEKGKISGGWALREELVGGAIRSITAEEKSPTNVSSFIGDDPSAWRSNISTYGIVNIGEVYEGIGLKLKAYGNNVEKLFTVKPGADPRMIRLQLTGAKDISINKNGELEARTDYGPITFSKPIAFQDIQGKRLDVPVRYALLDQGNTYGFTVAEYDPDHELVIDPLLQATYLGGISNDSAYAIAIDASGNVFIAGSTQSADFPKTAGGARSSHGGGNNDAFVAKLDSSLTSLLQSTYLGGSADDYARAIALDTVGNVFIVGSTASTDFPGTAGGYQPAYGGGNYDAFVAKLDSSLTSLLQSTYLGGSGVDYAYAIALDAGGYFYVVGETNSTNFPGTTSRYQSSNVGGYDAFVAKLNSSLTSFLQSTYLGGSADDYARAITLDAVGNVFIAGSTQSVNFPGTTYGAQRYHGADGGDSDAFVAKLDSTLTFLNGATYLGGSGYDSAYAIAINAVGKVIYVAGTTGSTDFPITNGGAQASNGGSVDAFVANLNSSLTSLIQATYLGGSGADYAYAIALDSGGNVYVSGQTASTNFLGTPGGAQSSYGGGTDAFVTKLAFDLKTLSQSTYLGGSGADYAYAIALDSGGNVYVSGQTASTNFPAMPGGAQSSNNSDCVPKPGGCSNIIKSDAFVARLDSTLTGNALTVSLTGNGTGAVTSNPAGINCGLDCTEKYGIGTTITLTATADTGYTFTGWSGGCSGTGTCNITMANLDVTVAAIFNDITAPTGNILIKNGAVYTSSPTVSLQFSYLDTNPVTEMKVSNTDSDWDSVTAEPYAATKSDWTLTAGDGTKAVYVRFKDFVGNWSTTSYNDTIIMDTALPNPTITSPDNGASVTFVQAIGGTASDVTPSSGLNRVELQITDGAGNYLTADGTWTTPAAFFTPSGGTPANWSHAFLSSPWIVGTTYTITTRAFDNAGNSSQEVTSTFTFIAAKKAYTELTVTPSSVSILQNGKVDVTGMLSVPGAPEENLSNKEIILKITYKPDQGDPVVKAEISANTNDDTSGHYLSTGIEKDGQGNFIFSQKGIYTIQASFTGSTSLMSATAETFVVVGQVAGYAILVQGRIEADSEGLASHNKTTNRIYNVLKTQRGFIDSNIYYFNYTMPQDGVVVDEVPTQAGIQWAIETWAYGMLVSNPAPLYIIMVDHGTNGDFYIGNKTITPTNLADWLDNLEGTLKRVGGAQALAALAERRIVIIGACYSGSFITQRLSKPATPGAPDRLIVTSAAANEESYKGPDELDTVRSGEYFMEEFFIKLGRGYTFRNSFEEAARKTREYTRKGGTSANSANKYFDDAVQHPLLEDNGDWTGSNTLSDVQGKGDGHVVKNLLLGVGPTYDTNSAENPAEIVSVTETRYLSPSETSATLELWANRPKVEIDPAWVEVRTPAKELIGTGGKSQLALGLRKFFMSSVDETTKRWATIPPVADANEGIFTESGKYEALYFVSDKATGKISPMKRSVIYKKRSESDNPPPATFSLIEPGNDSTPKTVVVFRWEASSDPDGVTYNLVIAKDSDFKNVVYRREEIPVPMTYVDNTILVKDATPENPTGMRLGLKDDTDYYWKIEAVDGYGAITVSTDSNGNPQVWHFHTDNTNGYPGILTGIIYTDQTFAQITSAAIQATVSSALLADTASTAGQFAMAVPYQGEVTLTVSAPDYYPATVSGVSVQPGETTKVYVPMTQKLSGDINRDGVISMADLILILKICARLPIPPEAEVHVEAAINNRIGLAEAIYILQILAEIR